MLRVAQLLLLTAALVFGLLVLITILGSSATDAGDLVRTFGWWGVAVFLAWPALMTVLVLRQRR